jgi:hypothetical protein
MKGVVKERLNIRKIRISIILEIDHEKPAN